MPGASRRLKAPHLEKLPDARDPPQAEGRFGKQGFVYDAVKDEYRCPVGERITWRYNNVEKGPTLQSYWTTTCPSCSIKSKCTTSKERRIRRWEHEDVIDAMQRRSDEAPTSMRVRR